MHTSNQDWIWTQSSNHPALATPIDNSAENKTQNCQLLTVGGTLVSAGDICQQLIGIRSASNIAKVSQKY